jgi:hypothetical protein
MSTRAVRNIASVCATHYAIANRWRRHREPHEKLYLQWLRVGDKSWCDLRSPHVCAWARWRSYRIMDADGYGRVVMTSMGLGTKAGQYKLELV